MALISKVLALQHSAAFEEEFKRYLPINVTSAVENDGVAAFGSDDPVRQTPGQSGTVLSSGANEMICKSPLP
jgi:hypothetical protein